MTAQLPGTLETPVRSAADWISDTPRSHGLGFYVELLRARLWIVILIFVITVGSTALLVTRADKTYEAHADLLVTPIRGDNEDLFGLGLLSESGDPTRDAETLARLITTTAVAERVRSTLGAEQAASELLDNVTAEPVAQSSIVTITARANSPESAAHLANAFAEGAIAVRTVRMRRLLDSVIPQLRGQLADLPAVEAGAREQLSGRIRSLETLRLLPDPTLHLEAEATVPRDAVAPRPVLSIGASLVAALVLAFGVILGAHFVGPRIESEEDLRQYRIPVIGRIPTVRRRVGQRAPVLPEELDPATLDAFHRVASSLVARTPAGERAIFVTSAGPGDGKTTTSINLAAALAALSERVILVDGDSRRPMVAQTLEVTPVHGFGDVVTDQASVAEALLETDRLAGGVQVLARGPGEFTPTPISAEAADKLIREATQRGAWLLTDGAALAYAPDLLPLAKRVATLVIVVHIRRTRARDLADLGELLTQQGITPSGFIVIGGKPRAVYG